MIQQLHFWVCAPKNREQGLKGTSVPLCSQQPTGGSSPGVPMDEWINKMWHKHNVEYYSALKRKGILAPATTSMSLEDRTRSEVSQSQKDKYCVTLLTELANPEETGGGGVRDEGGSV